MSDAVCKGTWRLGTACGLCSRCQTSAAELIPSLLIDAKKHYDTIAALQAVLSPVDGALSPTFKAASYDEARRILYERKP